MSSEKETRSTSLKKQLFSDTYIEIDQYRPTSKLPLGSILIGRMIYLLKAKKGFKTMSLKDASNVVATEVRNDWINKNVYPMHKKSVARKVKTDYEHFVYLRKQLNCEKKRKSEKFLSDASAFNESLTLFAYNIRCHDKVYQEQMEADFGVKMNKTDEAFYKDNCFGTYKFTCTNSVPKDWVTKRKRKLKRQQSESKKVFKLNEESAEQKLLDEHELHVSLNDELSESDENELSSISTEINKNKCRRQLYAQRKCDFTQESNVNEDTTIKQFPKVLVRSSRNVINESVIRCLVQCLSETTVSCLQVCKIMANVANLVFNQDWKLPQKKEDTEKDNEESQENYSDDEDDFGPGCSKKDLSYTLPSRRTIMRYVDDASLLNLKYVADKILQSEDSTITVGLDDTTKAAGHRLYDIKTDHITIKSKSEKRQFLTTGYIENVSHTGKDGADAYNYKLKCLSILANCEIEDLKANINFWMSDRGSELDTLFEKLEIEDGKRLKCCAHIILGIDNAIDKVMKNTEQMIGVQKLLQLTAGERVFTSPNSSIHTLGLIALAKLLSPSHASHSISLYNDYKCWLQMNETLRGSKSNFKGFVSNRFGRVAELSKIHINQKDYIKHFFEDVVDIHSNNLVLAVATYIQNDWFSQCSEIYAEIGDMIIFPLMLFLGIDEGKEIENERRNWEGIKEFFQQKLSVLKDYRKSILDSEPNGIEKLKAAILEEVVDTIERQISQVAYLRKDEVSEINKQNLKNAPLTNLGCESEFAKFDNRVKATGGSTSVNTHSKKNIIATNRFLVNTDFSTKSNPEKREQWAWARNSKEAKEVRKMQDDFIETIHTQKKIAIIKKEKLKKEKSLKTLQQMEICKKHGGPLTPNCIDILPGLNTEQLLAEVSFLRLTTAPHIRQMRRKKCEDGRYRMEKFSDNELKTSLINAIKPVEEVSTDIEELLNNVL